MLFSQSIPDSVLENSAASKFVSVLDSLQEVKQGIISDAVRSFNPILCMNEKWLRKYLTDYGFGDIPKGFPVRVLQQMLLNADTIMRLRGSKLGVEFFLSVCSLGVATIDASRLRSVVRTIYTDSTSYGYITDSKGADDHKYRIYDSDEANWEFAITDEQGYVAYGIDHNGVEHQSKRVSAFDIIKWKKWYYSNDLLFLAADSDLTENSYLSIKLSSKYFNGLYPMEKEAIMRYLRSVLPNYVGFVTDLRIKWDLNSRTKFYYHGLLNPQYINTEVSSDFDPITPHPPIGGVTPIL